MAELAAFKGGIGGVGWAPWAIGAGAVVLGVLVLGRRPGVARTTVPPAPLYPNPYPSALLPDTSSNLTSDQMRRLPSVIQPGTSLTPTPAQIPPLIQPGTAITPTLSRIPPLVQPGSPIPVNISQ